MPRRKRIVPDASGRASIAALVERKAEEVAAIADELRKPASLCGNPVLLEAKTELQRLAQSLQDVAVGISIGQIEVHLASSPAAEPTLFPGPSPA